jgi:dihydroorotate dehydrogenase electron transfer subunit
LRTIDIIRDTQIESVVQESSNIRSFFFKDDLSLGAEPGQFAMIWLPDAGEFPMSLSLPSKELEGLASIGVKSMGLGSKMLYESKIGDLIGVRGPYGKSFDTEIGSSSSKSRKKMMNVLLVGGGTGMVPLLVLAEALSKKKRAVNTKIIVGARTKEELPFLKISKKIAGAKNVFSTTDDGSFGFKGLAHELVERLVEKYNFDSIFSCGPEKMMAQVLRIAERENIPAQFSLERIMKCGIGICGSCTIGDLVLCKDGPILKENQISRLSEFGHFHRDKTGKLVQI